MALEQFIVNVFNICFRFEFRSENKSWVYLRNKIVYKNFAVHTDF